MGRSYLQPETLAAVLEVLASKRPEVLAPTVEVLRASPAGAVVHQLAKRWGVTETETLARDLRIAGAKLSALERRRGRWRVDDRGMVRGGGRDVRIPAVCMTCDLAAARAGRVAITRSEKLWRIVRKLEGASEVERTRRLIGELMADDPEPKRAQEGRQGGAGPLTLGPPIQPED